MTATFDPAKFADGTLVLVAPQNVLESFLRPAWRYHHPLQVQQLAFAGTSAKVLKSYMYHGGDMLYQLDGVPGPWHEECLLETE